MERVAQTRTNEIFLTKATSAAERELSNPPFREAEETKASFRERVGHPLFVRETKIVRETKTVKYGQPADFIVHSRGAKVFADEICDSWCGKICTPTRYILGNK